MNQRDSDNEYNGSAGEDWCECRSVRQSSNLLRMGDRRLVAVGTGVLGETEICSHERHDSTWNLGNPKRKMGCTVDRKRNEMDNSVPDEEQTAGNTYHREHPAQRHTPTR